jgi:hypothetical protein
MRKHTRRSAGESSVDPARLERELLRKICRATLPPAAWTRIAGALRRYSWLDAEHAIVYAAIERLRARDPFMLREQLPAQATRMGFPDIEWRSYFSPEQSRLRTPTASEITRLIERMQKAPA